MVYGLRLGRSRIFTAPAAYSYCTCFVAGEPGGGCVLVQRGRMRRRGCVEARRGGQRRVCRRRAAVGKGLRCPKRLADGLQRRAFFLALFKNLVIAKFPISSPNIFISVAYSQKPQNKRFSRNEHISVAIQDCNASTIKKILKIVLQSITRSVHDPPGHP